LKPAPGTGGGGLVRAAPAREAMIALKLGPESRGARTPWESRALALQLLYLDHTKVTDAGAAQEYLLRCVRCCEGVIRSDAEQKIMRAGFVAWDRCYLFPPSKVAVARMVRLEFGKVNQVTFPNEHGDQRSELTVRQRGHASHRRRSGNTRPEQSRSCDCRVSLTRNRKG
jgi:hypothetical protein